jgi:hypothetical protein
MGNRPGFFKGDKRKKEVARQKRQEEKRLRRLNKPETAGQEGETPGAESPPAEGGGESDLPSGG